MFKIGWVFLVVTLLFFSLDHFQVNIGITQGGILGLASFALHLTIIYWVLGFMLEPIKVR